MVSLYQKKLAEKSKKAFGLVSEEDSGTFSQEGGGYKESGLKEKHQEERENVREAKAARREEQADVDANARTLGAIPVVGPVVGAVYRGTNKPAPVDEFPSWKGPEGTNPQAKPSEPVKFGPAEQKPSTPSSSTSGEGGRTNEVTKENKRVEFGPAQQTPSTSGTEQKQPGASGVSKIGGAIGNAANKALEANTGDYIRALANATKGEAVQWGLVNQAGVNLQNINTTVSGPEQDKLDKAAQLNYKPWEKPIETAESQWRKALGMGNDGNPYDINKFKIDQTALNQFSQGYTPSVTAVTADTTDINNLQNQAVIPSVQTGFDVAKANYQQGQAAPGASFQTSGVAYNDITGNEVVPTGPQTIAQANMRQALDAYRRAAAGQEPSAAAIQQQRGMEQAQAQQQAILAGKDFNAASLRTAQQNIMGLQQEAARSAAELRAKEMETARAGWANLSTTARQAEINNAKARADIDLARDDLNMNSVLKKYQIDVDEKTKYDLAKLDGDLKARTTDAANTLQKYGYDLDTATKISLNNSQVQSQARFKEAELISQKYGIDTQRMVDIERANQVAQVNMEKLKVDTILAAQSQENQMKIASEADKLKAAGMSTELALKAAIEGAGLKIDSDFKTGQLELQKRAEIYRGELTKAGMQQEQIMEAVKLRFGGDLERLRIAAQADIEKTRQQLQREVQAGNISQQEADRTLQWISTGVSAAGAVATIYYS